MRFLIIFLFCISLNAQIPNTAGGWGLDDVRTYIGLSTTASLQDCFTAADPSCFDPTYEGSKDRLSNFRNYDCGLSTFAHALGVDGSSGSNSCANYPTNTFYTDNSIWGASSELWTDSGGTTPASSGYYSDGVTWRYWNGSTFTMSDGC